MWKLPSVEFLITNSPPVVNQTNPHLGIIERVFSNHGVKAQIVESIEGPQIFQYSIQLADNARVAKLTGLEDELALALGTSHLTFQIPIPGKPLVGLEVPKSQRQIIYLSDVLDSPEGTLVASIGKDIYNKTVNLDIAELPHLLIAGASGSGKSVGLNALILSLLMRYTPDVLQLICIDPKLVELSSLEGIPHLKFPIITRMGGEGSETALGVLAWAVNEMNDRLRTFATAKARNIKAYNAFAPEKLPYIILVVDELGDLMLNAEVEPQIVETLIVRLAQKARAAGIHLILSTQRPSVDVVTGLIKANITARIAFKVASQSDSRVILDAVRAEKLTGRGDMLVAAPDSPDLTRAQGVYVSDEEISKIVEFWRNQASALGYTVRDFILPSADDAQILGGAKKAKGKNWVNKVADLERQILELTEQIKAKDLEIAQLKAQINVSPKLLSVLEVGEIQAGKFVVSGEIGVVTGKPTTPPEVTANHEKSNLSAKPTNLQIITPKPAPPNLEIKDMTPKERRNWQNLIDRVNDLSKLERQILLFLANNSKHSYSSQELERWLRKSKGSVSKHPPSTLLTLGLISRDNNFGYSTFQYKSNLENYLAKNFDGFKAIELVEFFIQKIQV